MTQPLPRVLYTGTRPPPPHPRLDLRHLPLLEVRPLPVDWPALANSLSQGPPTALVFTSSHAARLAHQAGLFDSLRPEHHPIWCVGPRTAGPLASLGLQVHLPPDDARHFEGLTAAMAAHLQLPHHILALSLEDSPRDLADALPHHQIDTLAVYATGPRRPEDLHEALGDLLPVDWIALLSPRGLDALWEVAPALLRQARLAAIGPPTSAAIEARGLEVAAMCEEPGARALLEAIAAANVVG